MKKFSLALLSVLFLGCGSVAASDGPLLMNFQTECKVGESAYDCVQHGRHKMILTAKEDLTINNVKVNNGKCQTLSMNDIFGAGSEVILEAGESVTYSVICDINTIFEVVVESDKGSWNFKK